MKVIKTIENERLVELTWEGPYILQHGELHEHPVEKAVLPDDGPGLYTVVSDYPLHGTHSLAYVGRTDRLLSSRLREHKWLAWEWRLELYISCVDDPDVLSDAERLLIRAHQPRGNSQHLGGQLDIDPPLRLWNTGRFWGLFLEVSSSHEWFRG